MLDKPIAVVYQECSEGEADAEHTYYKHIKCGKCSEHIGTTLQEKLREEVTQCPNCKCTLDYQDSEIEHHGIKGMRWGVIRSKAELGYGQKIREKEAKADYKQERDLLKVRKENDRMIRKGLKRLSSMTPEEADAFMAKVKQINAGDALNEERIRSIANTKISRANMYKANLDLIDSGLKVAKTGISIATQVSKDSFFKDLSKNLDDLGKAKTAMDKNSQVQRGQQDQSGKPISPQRVKDLSRTYALLTGSSKKEAKKRVQNLALISSRSTDLSKNFAKALKEDADKKKKEEE